MPDVATSKSLVLVVGARVSKDIGLPTGAELKLNCHQSLMLFGAFYHNYLENTNLLDCE
jgi:hypothetical protein